MLTAPFKLHKRLNKLMTGIITESDTGDDFVDLAPRRLLSTQNIIPCSNQTPVDGRCVEGCEVCGNACYHPVFGKCSASILPQPELTSTRNPRDKSVNCREGDNSAKYPCRPCGTLYFNPFAETCEAGVEYPKIKDSIDPLDKMLSDYSTVIGAVKGYARRRQAAKEHTHKRKHRGENGIDKRRKLWIR